MTCVWEHAAISTLVPGITVTVIDIEGPRHMRNALAMLYIAEVFAGIAEVL